ncbi:MAG: tetratricopeptide repeat protein [Ignavibacteriae bacterium]|nr:tetratricopeptide repeat protein [Ignavibacteriota bacterium]
MKKRSNKNISKTEFLEFNVDGVEKADLGNYIEALQYFNKAIETDPKNFVSYFNRASIKMNLGDIEGAKMDFQISEKLDANKVNYTLI